VKCGGKAINARSSRPQGGLQQKNTQAANKKLHASNKEKETYRPEVP
jgi:hypothetical protein